MKKFVHKYLDSFFEIKKSSTNADRKLTIYEFDAIVQKGTDDLFHGNRLLKELVCAAYIDEVTLKVWVEEWARSTKPLVDLTLYWQQEEPLLGDIVMPLVRRVAAQTMAMDLVAVKPMETPKGLLHYIDYQIPTYHISGNTNTIKINKNGRRYNSDAWNENIAQLLRNQENQLIGDLNHPDPPLFISSRTPLENEEIERKSWFNPESDEKDLDNPK